MIDRGGTTKRLAMALVGATLVLAAGACSGASPSPTSPAPTLAPVMRSISGTATVATTGMPVAGVRIRGRSLPPPGLIVPDPPEAIAVTDARGAYTLSFPIWPGGNPPALFLTLELPPGFLLVAMTNLGLQSGPCELNAGRPPPALGGSVGCRFDDLGDGPIDITLALGHVVEGSVTSGLSGAPLAGVQVSALKLNSILIDGNPASDAFEVEAVASTDATGRYSLTVPSGSYVIYAQEPGGSQQRFWSDDPTVFQATPLSVERAIAGVNIALVPVTVIRGEVRSGPTQFVDAVAGIRVVAYLAGDTPCCRIGGVAITSEGGFFLMYIPPGLYRIEFDPPAGSPYAAEWWSAATGFATATDVTVGSEPIQIEVELAPLSP